MFNVAVYKYPSGYQYRVYKNGFLEKSKGEFFPGDVNCRDSRHDSCGKRSVSDSSADDADTIQDMQRSRRVSLSRTRQMVYYLCRSNNWEWFFTFTFNPEKVDSFCYDDCVQVLSDWLSNMRKKCPGMIYLVVPELHKSGRFHFHGLFSCCDDLGFSESGHYTKSGEIIYNISSYKFGFSTATRVLSVEKVSKYICKYVTKDLLSVAFGRRRYWASRNVNKAPVLKTMIKVGKRNSLLDFLSSRCSFQKVCDGLYNTCWFFDFLASDNIDISDFFRTSDDG